MGDANNRKNKRVEKLAMQHKNKLTRQETYNTSQSQHRRMDQTNKSENQASNAKLRNAQSYVQG